MPAGEFAMDMSLIGALIGAQTGSVQTQVAATIMKSNMDAEKASVATLLGQAQQNMNSLANVAAGVGGNVNISA
jgi:hypothetical protein